MIICIKNGNKDKKLEQRIPADQRRFIGENQLDHRKSGQKNCFIFSIF
jgi:hypothetical protein